MPLDVRYQGTQITAPPDLSGPFGKAWRVTMPPLGQRRKPDFDATVDMFLVQRRAAHPVWDHWLVSLVHLRPMAGVRPAHVTVAGATHELMIVALNPEFQLPPLDCRSPLWAPKYLTPIDVTEQFPCPDDAFAQHFLELSVTAIVNGYISPDEAARALWKESIATTLRHYGDGTHRMRRPS